MTSWWEAMPDAGCQLLKSMLKGKLIYPGVELLKGIRPTIKGVITRDRRQQSMGGLRKG